MQVRFLKYKKNLDEVAIVPPSVFGGLKTPEYLVSALTLTLTYTHIHTYTHAHALTRTHTHKLTHTHKPHECVHNPSVPHGVAFITVPWMRGCLVLGLV